MGDAIARDHLRIVDLDDAGARPIERSVLILVDMVRQVWQREPDAIVELERLLERNGVSGVDGIDRALIDRVDIDHLRGNLRYEAHQGLILGGGKAHKVARFNGLDDTEIILTLEVQQNIVVDKLNSRVLHQLNIAV